MNEIYEVQKNVAYSECDWNGKLSITSIFEIVENCLSFTSTLYNCDNGTLKTKYNYAWMICKTKCVINHLPFWNESIVIKSRFIKSTRITAYLLVECYDVLEDVLFSCICESCVVDIALRKIVKLENIDFKVEDEGFDCTIKLNQIDGCMDYDVEVMPSMIDFSKHLNNTKMISKFIDHINTKTYDELTSGKFDMYIQYLSQAYLFDKLVLKVKDDNTCSGFDLQKEEKAVIKYRIEKK